MRRKFNRAQRNYIIAGLCMILVIMAVGYAAFASQLRISGTSNISSNFLVKIIDIQSTVLSGSAYDTQEPTHTDLTADFYTGLVSPGDAMKYDITVENQGNIDAYLNNIEISDSNNEAIIFETSGMKNGDGLLEGTSDVLTIIVRYNSSVTSQPGNLNSSLTVTLDYGQNDGSYLPGVDGPSIGGQPIEVVESGDGLYEDENISGRYVYRGTNPNNYITFNNETWRIIAKEADGTYKILRNDILSEEMPFDQHGSRTTGYCSNMSSDGCNAWASTTNMVGSPAEFVNGPFRGVVDDDSTLNKYLANTYLPTITTNNDKIVSYAWNIGGVAGDDNYNGDLALMLEEEANFKWNGKVALASASDYLNANSNQAMCNSGMLNSTNLETCVTTNWMFIEGVWWFVVSPTADSGHAGAEFHVDVDGPLNPGTSRDSRGVRPAVYLSSSISLTGEGTQSNPFRIN